MSLFPVLKDLLKYDITLTQPSNIKTQKIHRESSNKIKAPQNTINDNIVSERFVSENIYNLSAYTLSDKKIWPLDEGSDFVPKVSKTDIWQQRKTKIRKKKNLICTTEMN